MEILITNDDGVFSPGLAAAVEAALAYGNVSVAAPSSQKTSAGRSLFGDRSKPFSSSEITADSRRLSAWHLDGTPALVVRHALSTVFRNRKFDLAISGINYGENLAYDISVSGTVGAAIECAVKGIPAIAVSMQTAFSLHHSYGEIDWSAAKHFLGVFIRRFIDKGSFEGFDILKIDVPIGANETTEWLPCRLHRGSYYLSRMARKSDDAIVADSSLYTDDSSYEPGTDAHTLAVLKKVAVAPLSLDWTGRDAGGFFA